MSRATHTWLMRCSTCQGFYNLSNLMRRYYIEAGTGKKRPTDLHKLKHLKDAGMVVELVSAHSVHRRDD